MFKNKKILITGGTGVIGHELITLLKERGANIRVVDMRERPTDLEGVEYFQLDLARPDSQFLFRFDPEYIFHLAADFERSTEDLSFWDANFLNNILASHYLLKEVVKRQSLKKIIFASSYLIYDKNLYHNASRDNVLSEESVIDPRNICGISKLQTERDLEFFYEQMQKKFDYACARIFRVYGRGSRDIISRWVRAALNGEELGVFDKDNAFDYIYAGDVALGLLKIAESKKAIGIINLATGSATKIGEVFLTIKKAFPKIHTKEIKSSIYKEASCANVGKLKKLTGWSPQTSLKEGINKIINYEKENCGR
ncbi:MAG: NAD(P)-dependent oxidoreductase [Candidatus Staskawiczbacteria bacterium]|nr:NAD(P)-dependent oxidoreductase [Candidatus Staskawiczbacteria bacterium]